MLLGRAAGRQAHLRGHSGRNAGLALAHCPTAPEFTIPPHLFRTLLLERLRLPLQFTEATCEGCQAPLGHDGSPLGFMDTERQGEATCRTHRAHDSPCVPRGRCVCPSECVLERHERECSDQGFQAHRSPCSELAMFWRSAAGSGHHVAQFTHLQWRSSPTRCRA